MKTNGQQSKETIMKVGLMALSGVRVKNEKLVKLGVTLPQFVSRGQVIAQLPSLSLLIIASTGHIFAQGGLAQ